MLVWSVYAVVPTNIVEADIVKANNVEANIVKANNVEANIVKANNVKANIVIAHAPGIYACNCNPNYNSIAETDYAEAHHCDPNGRTSNCRFIKPTHRQTNIHFTRH